MEFQEKMKNPAYANAVRRNANKSAWVKKHRLEKMYDMTPSEKKVWDYINNSKLKKYGFEPQVDFSIQGHLYFGDFVSKRCRLVIEVDGGYHSTKKTQEKDDVKNADFDFFGYSIFRIKNEEVEDIENLHALGRRIKSRFHQSSIQKYHNNIQDEYQIDETNIVYNNIHGKETGEIRERKDHRYWTKKEMNDFFLEEEARLISEGYLKPRKKLGDK